MQIEISSLADFVITFIIRKVNKNSSLNSLLFHLIETQVHQAAFFLYSFNILQCLVLIVRGTFSRKAFILIIYALVGFPSIRFGII